MPQNNTWEILRTDIWKSLLIADYRQRYCEALATRYYNRDLKAKIFLAIMSSGTVASWAFWTQIEILWKILSGISALLAIILPLLNWPQLIGKTTTLAQQWREIKDQYDLLWEKVKNPNPDLNIIQNDYTNIRNKATQYDPIDPSIPGDKKLANQCQTDVINIRTKGEETR